MTYTARDYSPLIGMEGFSETLLKNHFTLYQGYVSNTNKLCELLSNKAKDATDPGYAEVKRRFGFEFNGMRLHEYYFENLGGKTPLDKSGSLAKLRPTSRHPSHHPSTTSSGEAIRGKFRMSFDGRRGWTSAA